MNHQSEKFKCIICGNGSFKIPFDSRGFKVLECTSCYFGIVDPIPGEDELNRLYNSSEYFATHMQYDYENISQEQINNLIEQTGRLHEKYLAKYLKPQSKILEIGTGGGFALKYFQNKGYTVKGVETSDPSVRFAREKLDLDIDQNHFEQFKDDSLYDVIMLNHVLEHFTDVIFAMKLIVSKLNKGGILYIRVPNHDSYDRRVYKEQWPAYLPFHISYFSRKSLQKLYDNFNCSVSEIDEFVSEKFLSFAPAFFGSIARKFACYAGLTKYFNGRTITIIGQLK